LGIGPNPQSPIPNPQSPSKFIQKEYITYDSSLLIAIFIFIFEYQLFQWIAT
jgi:hypothetical protein